MDLKVSQDGEFVVAKVGGALDESAREPFRDQLHPLVVKQGSRLVLDLSGVTWINSAGIGSLVALVAVANTQGSNVTICGLTPFAASVMSHTKLDTYFNIVASVDDARGRL